MEHETELEKLIADQRADDTYSVTPEFRNMVPLDEVDDLLGMEPDGEIISFEHANRPRGSVLVGTASWHGTRGGYTNHGCRCDPCSTAKRAEKREITSEQRLARAEYMREYRRRKSDV